MSHRQQQKEEARQKRLAAEREEAARAARKKRLQRLGIVAGVAAAAVVVLLLVAGGGGDEGGEQAADGAVAGAAEVQTRYGDVPQSGNVLGDPDAPLVMYEFADMQCPFCAQYSNEVHPQIVDEYVRTGQMRIEMRLLRFIGPDSDRAARVASFAGERDRLWHFADLFFQNQGAEGTGYATDEFLSSIAEAAGVPGDEAVDAIQSPDTEQLIIDSEQQAQQLNVNSTPSFAVARGDEDPEVLEIQELTFDAFQQALEPHLEGE